MFDESKHPRDADGKFTDGAGGTHRATPAENERLRQLGIGERQPIQKIELSKQEYAVLRNEVVRKNSAQKRKAKPTNFAYTSNYFYIYLTNGGDSFVPLKQYDIEKDRDLINDWLELWGERI